MRVQSCGKVDSLLQAVENPDQSALLFYRESRISHWNKVAVQSDDWNGWGVAYHQRLIHLYQHMVAPGQRVIELGCGQGDLLASLQPSVGVGVDFSSEMLQRAKKRHTKLRFIQADANEINLEEQFDVIIVSDLVNDLWDVQAFFENCRHLATAHTRIIVNSYSRLWELPLAAAERLGLVKPKLCQNWLTVEDISNLLNLADFEVIRSCPEIICPLHFPFLETMCNRYLVKLWPFKMFALTNFIVARPYAQKNTVTEDPLVSVIVPARNEAGNIPHIFARVPKMGSGTELVFIEGHSTDNTFAAVEQAMAKYPQIKCQIWQQSGTGKGDAVRLGFSMAKGEILMILDADLTVPPEDLPRFYNAIRHNKGEFINGVRLVYPMEKEAMRFFNLLGNKFFSKAFSWLLGQAIKDSLCGTKVLWKTEYELIAANRNYFGEFDPFGDFDLLFGAAKLNLKIVDLPIRYRERTYGATNIQRWKHGWLLLKMVLFAAMRIKFI